MNNNNNNITVKVNKKVLKQAINSLIANIIYITLNPLDDYIMFTDNSTITKIKKER